MYLITKVFIALAIIHCVRYSIQDQQRGVKIPFGLPWFPANIVVMNYNVTHEDGRYNLMTSTVDLELQLFNNLLPFNKIGFLRSEQLVPCDKVQLVKRDRMYALDCRTPAKHVVDEYYKGPSGDYEASTKLVRQQVIHARHDEPRLPYTFDRLVIYPLKRSEASDALRVAFERLNRTDELNFNTRPGDFGYYFEADVQFGASQGGTLKKCTGNVYVKKNDYGAPGYRLSKMPPFVQDFVTLFPLHQESATFITGDQIQCEHPLAPGAGATMETNFTLVLQNTHPYYTWKHSTRSSPNEELLQISSSYWEHFDMQEMLFLADFDMYATSPTSFGSVDLVGSQELGRRGVDTKWISLSMPSLNLNVSYAYRLVKNQKPPLFHRVLEVFDTASGEEDPIEPVMRVDTQKHLHTEGAMLVTKITPEFRKRLVGYENWFKLFGIDLETVRPMEQHFDKMPIINTHTEL